MKSLIIIMSMAVFLVGCGGSDTSSDNSGSKAVVKGKYTTPIYSGSFTYTVVNGKAVSASITGFPCAKGVQQLGKDGITEMSAYNGEVTIVRGDDAANGVIYLSSQEQGFVAFQKFKGCTNTGGTASSIVITRS